VKPIILCNKKRNCHFEKEERERKKEREKEKEKERKTE
jgi:hypothetical protein